MIKSSLPITICPICASKQLGPYIELKDYFLTQEEFQVIECRDCQVLTTYPRPGLEEIGKYYISEEYSSHNTQPITLKNNLYRLARIISIRGKFSMIKHHAVRSKILDIGCGTGEFLNYCRRRGCETIGIEPNDNARNYAIKNYDLEIIKPEEANLLPPNSINVITLWHVLEHLEDPIKQLTTNHELLVKDGLLVLALPNYQSWDAKKYGKFWAGYDVPRHLYHFSKSSMNYLANKLGFRIVNILPLKLDAYYISLLSEKYANGKMNYFNAIINGWRSNRKATLETYGYSSWVYIMKKS